MTLPDYTWELRVPILAEAAVEIRGPYLRAALGAWLDALDPSVLAELEAASPSGRFPIEVTPRTFGGANFSGPTEYLEAVFPPSPPIIRERTFSPWDLPLRTTTKGLLGIPEAALCHPEDVDRLRRRTVENATRQGRKWGPTLARFTVFEDAWVDPGEPIVGSLQAIRDLAALLTHKRVRGTLSKRESKQNTAADPEAL